MRNHFICGDCGKVITGLTYSKRLADGCEIKMCFKCSDKMIRTQIERKRLQAWNTWAKR